MNAIFDRSLTGRIEAIIASPSLPEQVREQGRRLFRRLAAPVRVVIAGPAQSGKSALIKLLAGQCEGTAWSGPERRRAGAAPETLSSRFRNVVLVEFDFGAARESGAPASIEAVAPDIVLWCTNAFGADEAAFWATVPDHLKDHSFLVLTKADQLIRLGVLLDRLEDLRDVVEAEFHSLLPIATYQALAAQSDAQPDPVMHAASGAQALFDSLQGLIDQGRRADLDTAELFVHKYEDAAEVATMPVPPVPASPVPPSPAPAPIEPSGPGQPMSSAVQPGPAEESATAAPQPPLGKNAEISEKAMHILDSRTADMPAALAPDDREGISALLSLCGQTAEALTELVMEGDGICEDLSEDVLEASEMMVLLTLEDDENAAADAVTLLLQLRRGFEARLAA
jgi:hypothetical protein